MRVAFFADLHIYDDEIASQTDLGGPSKLIPKRLKEELNKIKPDLIFNLGDSTSFGASKEWGNYKKWRDGVNAPIYEVFGNHDRNYNVLCSDNVGEEFFTELGWFSDTKALRFGNNIFILVSEEYSPAGSEDLFTATIPDKRFDFVESVLQRYSNENNIWVLSHTPISGTTVLSTRWMCNNPKVWWQISKKYFDLYNKYLVLAHFTGHTHIDYRLNLKVKNEDGRFSKENRGTFLNGKDYEDLPDIQFLNMPCVDIAHGWLSGRFPFLIQLDDSYKHWKENKLRRAQLYLDSKGSDLVDKIIEKRLDRKIGRSAFYYMDLDEGKESCEIVTRDIASGEDVQRYKLDLNSKLRFGDKDLEFVDSDLSLQYRKGLIIDHGYWFKVLPDSSGVGVFSQRFSEAVMVKGVDIDADSSRLEEPEVWYKAGNEVGETDWVKDPEEIGAVKKIKVKIKFVNSGKKDVRVRDVVLLR